MEEIYDTVNVFADPKNLENSVTTTTPFITFSKSSYKWGLKFGGDIWYGKYLYISQKFGELWTRSFTSYSYELKVKT